MRHNRRLGIFGELEIVLRSLAHQLEQVLAKRLVNLAERVSSGLARIGQRCPHADRLAALTGKKKCAHRNPCLTVLRSRAN